MKIKHISTGYKPQFWQNQVHGCLKRFNVLVLHRRAGKALDIMTPIWTINGFKYMRDIVEGDVVFGSDGKPTKVIGVSDIMLTNRCFKLTFDDGAEIIADAEHLWYTETKLNRAATKVIDGKRTSFPKKGTVKTTLDLFMSQKYQNESNHSIPVTAPVEYEEQQLPIDPYILGVWLGDGSAKGAEVTTSFPYLQNKLQQYCDQSGFILTLKKGGDRAPTFYLKGGFKTLLRESNLLENKHIPDVYLKSSIGQRKALLAGLMDTDGHITKNAGNKCEFVQKRKELMDQVCVLMSSLGLKYSRKIKVVNGVDYHLILFAPLFNVFTIPYKCERYTESVYHKNRYIESVVEVESVPVKCIAVDNEDKIYLAGDRFIPTHNTVFSINEMIDQGLRNNLKNPKYAYMAPTYKQASIIAWDYLLEYTKNIPRMDSNKKDLEVTIKRPPPWDDKISYRLLGSDNPDSLRGIYLDGAVLDEFAQCDPIVWGEIIRPALADRKGWAIFISTPKGKNALYHRYEKAKNNPNWYTKILRADESGIIPKAELEEMRADMTEDEYEQELLCNFCSAAPGVYFGKLMAQLRRDGRIRSVPYDPQYPVDTFWDLGIGDSTAIWFRQRVGINWHYIDYYEKSGEGLEHYVKVLKDMPYAYGRHIVPHDAAARDLSTGVTRQEFLRKLGLRVEIQKRQAVDDRIQAIRTLLPKCYIDEIKCSRGVSALEDYQKEWDSKLMMYKNKPFHNWTSHGVDSFGYSALDTRDSDFEGTEFGKKLPERASGEYNEFSGV